MLQRETEEGRRTETRGTRTSLCLRSCLPLSVLSEPPESFALATSTSGANSCLPLLSFRMRQSPSSPLLPRFCCPATIGANSYFFMPRRQPAPPFPPGRGLLACSLFSLCRLLASPSPLVSSQFLPPHLACRESPVPFGHFLRLRPLTSPPALLASRPASLAALPSLAWRTGPPYSPPVRRPFPAPLLSGQTSLLIKRCIGGGSCLSPRASYKLGTSAGSGAIV